MTVGADEMAKRLIRWRWKIVAEFTECLDGEQVSIVEAGRGCSMVWIWALMKHATSIIPLDVLLVELHEATEWWIESWFKVGSGSC